MPKRRKYYRDILFGYMKSPELSFVGEDGGFSIAIYPDGRLVYKTYITDYIDDFEKTKEEIRLSRELVDEISAILQKYEHEISNLKRNIEYGSKDGIDFHFVFRGKRIITDSIPVIEPENVMMVILKKITQRLKREGIECPTISDGIITENNNLI